MSSGLVSDSGRARPDFEMNLKVDAGATILSWVSLRPIVGENGTFCFLSALFSSFVVGQALGLYIPKSAR